MSEIQETKLYNQLINNIIYQDKHILVINKPMNFAVQGGNKVKYSIDKIINSKANNSKILYRLTHRLDKDTSGVLILAKTEKSAKKITKLFQDKKIYKTYLALVTGKPEKKFDIINTPIVKKKLPSGKEIMQVTKKNKNVKSATTKYKVIDQLGDKLSLLEIEPLTGRKHQIRIHLASIGIPILGDGKYGGKNAFISNLSNKIHLHSYKIYIENYYGKPLSIKAPISDHLKNSLDELGILLPK